MNKLKSFNLKLADYIKGVKNNKSRFLPFFATTIAALDKSNLNDREIRLFKDFFTESINIFPKTSDLLSIYDQVNPDFIFSKVYQIVTYDHLKFELVDSYLSLFRLRNDQNKSPLSLDQAKMLFKCIAKFSDYFISEKDEIKKAIEEMFYEFSYIIIFDNKETAKKFISQKTIENYISTFKSEDLNLKEKLDLLNSFDIEKFIEKIVEKTLELIRFESSQSERDQRIWIAQFLINFINKSKKEIETIQDKNKFQEISSNILNWYSKSAEWDTKLTYYQVINILKSISNNPANPQLEAYIKNFVDSAPVETLRQLGKKEVERIAHEYQDEFINASVQDLKKLNLGIKGLSDSQMPNLCSKLLSKSDELQNIDEKNPYFELLAKLKCGGDSNLINQFHTKLLTLKPDNLDFVKRYSRKRGLFNSTQKLELK